MKLPKRYLESTIERMKPDEYGYTVPWAMWVNSDGEMLINGKYTVHSSTGGTVQMQIIRTETGVKVFRHGMDRYSPRSHHGYVGGEDSDMLPVEDLL